MKSAIEGVSVKAVVDTNIWVSALVAPFGSAAKLIELWKIGKFKLIISELQTSELYEVLSRSQFTTKYRIDEKKVEDLIVSIIENAEHILLEKSAISCCRDPDDDIIIETAIRGKAKYLVTGDKDIINDKTVLSFLSRHGVSVISLSRFLAIINKA